MIIPKTSYVCLVARFVERTTLPHPRLILLQISLTYLFYNIVILPFCAFWPLLKVPCCDVLCIELNSLFTNFRTFEVSWERKWMRPLIRVFFFLEHYFRLKCSNSFIFFFSQAKFKYIYILEIINVDFESISWFIQNEWFIYKSQMKIKISIGMVDRI